MKNTKNTKKDRRPPALCSVEHAIANLQDIARQIADCKTAHKKIEISVGDANAVLTHVADVLDGNVDWSMLPAATWIAEKVRSSL